MTVTQGIRPIRKWVQVAPTFWKLMSGAHPKPVAYVRDKGRDYFEWWLDGIHYGSHCRTFDEAKSAAIKAVNLLATRASSKSRDA